MSGPGLVLIDCTKRASAGCRWQGVHSPWLPHGTAWLGTGVGRGGMRPGTCESQLSHERLSLGRP
jgi:hypothetical protein